MGANLSCDEPIIHRQWKFQDRTVKWIPGNAVGVLVDVDDAGIEFILIIL